MGTTPTYGITYPASTGYVKDGATDMQTLATNVDTVLGTALGSKLHAGLVLVKTQTIGTGVSSVTVTNAFSSTYDNYKIIVSGGSATATGSITLQLTGITTGYYSAGTYVSYGSTTVSGFTVANGAYFNESGQACSNNISVNVDLQNPYTAKPTSAFASWASNVTTSYAIQVNSTTASTASASGFTLGSTAGTWTGGTIYVYGYAKD